MLTNQQMRTWANSLGESTTEKALRTIIIESIDRCEANNVPSRNELTYQFAFLDNLIGEFCKKADLPRGSID